tara:strand:+ start:202 stop:1644 length:1443 start_codon:yes stop_codon:yes gene_type:complete
MRIILAFIASLIFQIFFAQEEVYKESTTHKIDEIISVVDEETGQTVLLNFHSNGIQANLFNSEFKKLKSIEVRSLPYKYSALIGFQLQDEKLLVLMTNDNRRNYAFATFDFNHGILSTKELDFKLKREHYLATLSKNNEIYMVSAAKKGSQMNIYEFNANQAEPFKNEIKFPEDTFIDRFDRSVDFYDVLRGSENNTIDKVIFEPVVINNEIPSSIEETQVPFKLYPHQDGFKLSIDAGIDYTTIVNVSIKEMSAKAQKFDYEMPEEKFGTRMKTNSFIYENKLFQFSLHTDEAKLKLIDLDSGKLSKELVFDREDKLKIANTPIVQLGGNGFKQYRELETANQFFRKTLNDAELGIDVIERDGLYEITFGNFKEIESNYFYVYNGNSLLGASIAGGLSALANQFLSYRVTKSVQFTGLFTKDMTHVEGEVKANIFDEIFDFSEEFRIDEETFFQIKDHYYYTYFDKKQGFYSVYKFPLN